jgi:hypothetical protein
MTYLKLVLSALAVFAALPGLSRPAAAQDGVHVVEAYARVSSPVAKSGAAFMLIENHSDQADRLLSVSTDAAEKAELHTHIAAADGVMQMRKIEGGIAIAGHDSHAFQRGGDHVMLFGLKKSLKAGDIITLQLTFERGGVVQLEVPVDLDRPEAAAADKAMNHDPMSHDSMTSD